MTLDDDGDDDDAFREKSPHVLRRLKFSGACRPDAPKLHGACLLGGRVARTNQVGLASTPSGRRGSFLVGKRNVTSRMKGKGKKNQKRLSHK